MDWPFFHDYSLCARLGYSHADFEFVQVTVFPSFKLVDMLCGTQPNNSDELHLNNLQIFFFFFTGLILGLKSFTVYLQHAEASWGPPFS